MGFLRNYERQLLGLLRIVVGLLFLHYGIAKIFHFPHVGKFDHLPMIVVVAGWIELIGGPLLILGLFTRPVAFICAGEMAFAYFLGHAYLRHEFFPLLNEGVPAILFCFTFLYISAAGPGAFALQRD